MNDTDACAVKADEFEEQGIAQPRADAAVDCGPMDPILWLHDFSGIKRAVGGSLGSIHRRAWAAIRAKREHDRGELRAAVEMTRHPQSN
jgi:hypothetical protein